MPPKIPNRVLTTWHTLWASITAHKVISAVVALAVLYGGYQVYKTITAPSAATRYVTTTVATGTLVASISETGQVSASSNIDIQSKSSGEVRSLPVAAGQHVFAGTALAYLDSTTAQQSVTAAQQALQSAQISLATAEGNLVQTRATGYNDVSNAFLNLSSVIAGLDTLLHDSTVSGHLAEANRSAYANMTQLHGPSSLAESAYQKVYISYNKALANFKATPRTADSATIDALIKETADAVADLSDALRASTNFLDSVNTYFVNGATNPPTALAGHISTLMSYTNTTTGYLTSLANDVTSLSANTQIGTDPLVIQSNKLSVQMKRDALAQAQQTLADTVVRAPFSGVVGKLNVQQYQTIGNGTSVATLVSDNQNVAISVNEVDAAKIKVGQKATITFDALPTISIAGTLSSVNTVGTAASGVVSYAAVVTFDTPNASVRPGMSATADIIIGSETGLVVPQSAVKTANGQSYVLTFDPPLADSSSSAGATSPTLPSQTFVTTGLSDDTNIVIQSGLSAGTQVVTKTVAGTSVTAPSSAAQSTSLFGGSGASTGGGTRALTR